MWGMSCENCQPTPLERTQQVCMLRLTTPHNPKVVGSNPAPATKVPRFCYLGFFLAFLWDTAITSDQFGGICCVNSTVFSEKLTGNNHLRALRLWGGFCFPLGVDPDLTNFGLVEIWVKFWSGYHRIPAPGIFLMAPSSPKPRPFS